MSKRNLLIKVGIVTSSILLGVMLTASKIVFLPQNKTGINNALGQQDFEIIGGEAFYESRFNSVRELMDAGKELVREIEAEGAVLLKNDDNTLPLKKDSKINLVGMASLNPAYGGRGSAQIGGKSDDPISLVDGIKGAKAQDGSSAGFSVNETLVNGYISNDQWTNERKNSISNFGGIAIYSIKRTSGEGEDLKNGKNGGADQLALTQDEDATLKGLKELKDSKKISKIIVLLNSANQVADFLDNAEYGIDAALWIGNPGITGMAAVGDIIGGAVNPSGHLSDMHWYNHDDNPVNKNFGAYEYQNASNYNLPLDTSGKVQTDYGTYDVYQEGMYVGYRYVETRYYDYVTERAKTGSFIYDDVVAHPFGYGKSYTDFEYSNFDVKDSGNTYTVSVDVKNVGDTYSGKDAVQVYVQKPYNDKAIERKIEVPAVELVGFAKTTMLAPGKSETVKIEVDKSKLAVYDAEVEKTYILNDGDYYLTAATDSHSAVNNILASQGYTTSNSQINQNGSKDLVYKATLGYDKETYSVSKATGKEITNLFDNSDINKFPGKGFNKVTYVTRNNWEETLPTENVKLKMSQGIVDALLAQDDQSLITPDNVNYPTYGAQNGLKLIDMIEDEDGNPLDYNDPKWDLFLDQLTWEQTCDLLSDGLRKTVALPDLGKPGTTDHNGPAGLTEAYGTNTNGLAAKNNDPDKGKRAPYYPCAGIIAATFNPELATKFGDMLGEDALWAGYAGLYGVAINTHRSPYEGRAFEYFSEDPFLAGTMAALESEALQSHGCNAYIKHFALNEQESCRQGVQIWLNEQTLREIYLKPFEMAVVDGKANNAMASFTRIGTEFNPACKALMTDFLRGECGMKGLVVTDMYDIGYEGEHLPTFIMAGCDLPDGAVKGEFDKFKTGYGNLAMAMRESAKRILYSTSVSNAMSNGEIVEVTPAWIIAVYSVDAVLGVLWLGAIGAGIYFAIADKKKKITK